MKGTKIKKEKEKCPECGGKLVPEEDRFVCSICGHPVFSKALRHKYLERNKNPIMKDLDTLPRATVLKKWPWLAAFGIGMLLGIAMRAESRWLFLISLIAGVATLIGMYGEKTNTKKGGKP